MSATMLDRVVPCRGCGRPIGFIRTVKGKTMPVDPEPVCFLPDVTKSRKYVLLDGKVVTGADCGEDNEGAWIGYVSHFETCPDADRFRHRRG
ncbi:MAG: hypothetical protein IJT00_02380 [Lachnospiraceae bacterium]|nr:hypothetical protein [Lachnospiraceae bacterium]